MNYQYLWPMILVTLEKFMLQEAVGGKEPVGSSDVGWKKDR